MLGLGTWAALFGVKRWKAHTKKQAAAAAALAATQSADPSQSLPPHPQLSSLACQVLSVMADGSNFIAVIVGFKAPQFNIMGPADLIRLLPDACAIAFVSFAGNWTIAKKFAEANKYQIDATQELIAEGLTNIMGVVFNSFVVSGGLARSAVNAERAVIQVSIVPLIDWKQMLSTYKLDTRLFTGVVVSLVLVMRKTAFASIVHLGRVMDEDVEQDRLESVSVSGDTHNPLLGTADMSEKSHQDTNKSVELGNLKTSDPTCDDLPLLAHPSCYFKDVNRFSHAVQIPGVAILRMDASLYFANCDYFKEVVKQAAS
eukprot:gene34652-42741_t